jgi:hypothetical protein
MGDHPAHIQRNFLSMASNGANEASKLKSNWSLIGTYPLHLNYTATFI